MAFMTYPLNYIDYDYEDAETWLATRSSGIFVKNDFAYSVSGIDTNITFGEGLAWIHNHKFAGKVFKNDSDFVVDFGVSDANYDRIDVASIQFDKVANTTKIVAKHGEAKTNPIIPAISQTEELYELYICSVFRKAGSVYITDGDVSDLRLSEYCGLMADNVTSIDTAAIYAQVMDLIHRLETEIAGVESSAEIMLKSVYDTDNDGVVDNAAMLGNQLPEYYATKTEVQTAQTTADNAVKKTGDTMTGDLYLQRTEEGSTYKQNLYPSINKIGDENTAAIILFKDEAGIANLRFNHLGIILRDSAAGKSYPIYGRHNKPIGSYTGNGSETSRTITIYDGTDGSQSNVLVIYRADTGATIVTPAGAISFNTSGELQTITKAQCSYANGILTIASSSGMINSNGAQYHYQAL